jgi:hypothetical protein
MPTPYSWTLVGGTIPASPLIAPSAGIVPELPPPITSFTQQEILDMFDRLFPDHWLSALKDPGPGYEVLQAYAKLASRMSEAVARLGADALITSAKGGVKATGEVLFARGSPNAEGIDVVIKAGTIVSTSRTGRDFKTLVDVTFLASDIGPFTVDIEAVAVGYEYNVLGEALAADGTTLEGDIDTIKDLVEDPQMGDLTFEVRQILPTSGGRDAALDQLGLDRGIARNQNDADPNYRSRVSLLPDTVSIDAISRLAKQTMEPFHSSFTLIETWDTAYQTCYDAPAEVSAGSSFDPNLFVYDDPDVDNIPFRNRWLDEVDHRGGVIIVLENMQPIADSGMIFDDTAINANDLYSSITKGKRGLSAYDIPINVGSSGYQLGCYDGYDAPRRAAYKSLYDSLQQIKAAGSSAAIVLRGQ